MAMTEEKRKTLKDFYTELNSTFTKQELSEAFRRITEYVKKIKPDLESVIDTRLESDLSAHKKELDTLKADFNTAIKKVNDESLTSLSGLRKRVLDGIEQLFLRLKLQEKLESFLNECRGKFDILENDISIKMDYLEKISPESVAEEALSKMRGVYSEEFVLSPEELRESLETLEGDERLDVSAIKGIEQRLASIESSVRESASRASVSGRDIFVDIDISSQLDGVTKTFNIHAVYNIISVHMSSFPNALRKGVDFTYTPTSITFTSEINAATSLATGQTCVLTVVTA